VGTVEPRRKAEIASRLLATVLEVKVHAGEMVAAGQTLIVLDDREIQAQFREAEAGVTGVEADLAVRDRDYQRYKAMFAEKAVTKEDYDRVEGAFQVTQAQLTRAREQVERIKVMLSYTTIEAPDSGIVADRYADPGDLAAPGKPLLLVHDPNELELHASVRESLAAHLRPGMKLGVRVDSADLDVEGAVREIVPQAETASRSVLVKVSLPTDSKTLYIGTFGRLHIPVGELNRIVVPRAAARTVGQLEMVDVVSRDGTLERRFVRRGEMLGDQVEILSGLRIGERVALPDAAANPS
jgi:RND family efflux transporter MFP subunit